MANPVYPPPIAAVNTHCKICGSSVYCGGPQCPSSSLSVAYDGGTQLAERYISIPIAQGVSMGQTGLRTFLVGNAPA